jgi:hypothetical protein
MKKYIKSKSQEPDSQRARIKKYINSKLQEPNSQRARIKNIYI